MTSRLGLGLAAVGRPAYITSGRDASLGGERSVPALRARAAELLDEAYAAGFRYLDVARSYGLAEDFLAGWLATRPDVRDVVVGSKWGYRYVGDWRVDAEVHEVKDHSLGAFRRQLAETRAVLGDRLDVYHVHSATLETGVLADGALHRALADLRETGVRVGVSTSGPQQAETVRRALEIEIDGHPLFTSFQVTWNLLERSAERALIEAAEAGGRVIVKEVLANGRLASVAEESPVAVRLGELAADQGTTSSRLAVAAALAQPWAWRVLSGAATVAQLRDNVAAAALGLPTGWSDDLPAPEPPAAYWAARSARAWS